MVTRIGIILLALQIRFELIQTQQSFSSFNYNILVNLDTQLCVTSSGDTGPVFLGDCEPSNSSSLFHAVVDQGEWMFMNRDSRCLSIKDNTLHLEMCDVNTCHFWFKPIDPNFGCYRLMSFPSTDSETPFCLQASSNKKGTGVTVNDCDDIDSLDYWCRCTSDEPCQNKIFK